ncbi:MAG: hypothetical protein GY950_28975 [bacterium]|nr:hypothetical protein [bacterium]
MCKCEENKQGKVKEYLEAAGFEEAGDEMAGNAKPVDMPKGGEQTLYAANKTIRQKDGRLYAQWHYSFGQACRGAPTSYVEEGAILDIYNPGDCSNGDLITLCVVY